MQAVSELDDLRLDRDQVELLHSCAPSQEELAALRAAAMEAELVEGDAEHLWDDAEAFVLKLSAVPQFALRLQAWVFENAFDERFEVFQGACADVHRACGALRGSVEVRRLLNLTLLVGNYLNAGTARGCADGFTMDALQQVRTVKAGGGAETLLDFVVRQCENARPGSLDRIFGEDGEAKAVRRASRVKLGDQAQELAAYHATAEGLAGRAVSASSESDDALAIRGHRIATRARELKELQGRFREADEAYRGLCAYLHEVGLRGLRPHDEFFRLWDGLFQGVQRALDAIPRGRVKRKRAIAASACRASTPLRHSQGTGDEEEGDPSAEGLGPA